LLVQTDQLIELVIMMTTGRRVTFVLYVIALSLGQRRSSCLIKNTLNWK
jgi:hypothetical protein